MSALTQQAPNASARRAGLHYVTSLCNGIQRLRSGAGFRYRTSRGRPVKNRRTLQRIRSLAIPPAWTDVRICPDPRGHLQAIGRDSRQRKQYRYHPDWRAIRDETKFDRMINFGRVLPRLRRRVRRDLRQRGLGREKILAALVQLMDLSAIRVGNEEYARTNKSYGLTTLKNHHAAVNGEKIQLRFRGKSGKVHRLTIKHPRLSRIVRKCRDLPGQELFEYLDEQGEPHGITSSDVNDYLLEASGVDFTSKDFRTWTGTILAARALCEVERANPATGTKRKINRAIERVAQQLGNTPAVCRKCYIHPLILDSYRPGTLVGGFRRRKKGKRTGTGSGLHSTEADVAALLQQNLRKARRART